VIVEFEAENVARGFNYNLYPREWQMNINKEQALALMTEIQEMLRRLDLGEIDE